MTGHFNEHVLERIHYFRPPAELGPSVLKDLESQIKKWPQLEVDMHVLDAAQLKRPPDKFYSLIKQFASQIRPRRVVTVNASEELFKQIVTRKMESSFNRVKLFPQDLVPRKKIPPAELKRLLLRYIVRAAYAAVEVTLHQTVSCDENYIAKPDKVPYSQFDFISVVDVRNDFLRAQFRLCSSKAVLTRAAHAMLGADATMDQETIESLAGELLNMIYGQAKSHLNDQEGFKLPAVIPKVLRQDQFSQIARSSSPDQLSIVPLVTPLGCFYVEVDLGIPA